jgi:hypothetical protein
MKLQLLAYRKNADILKVKKALVKACILRHGVQHFLFCLVTAMTGKRRNFLHCPNCTAIEVRRAEAKYFVLARNF